MRIYGLSRIPGIAARSIRLLDIIWIMRQAVVKNRVRAGSLTDTACAEAGVQGIEIWPGMFVPSPTPPEIVARLDAEMNRVLRMGDVREHIAPGGIDEPKGGSPEQFEKFVRAELAKWGKAVKDSGVKID